MLKIVVPAAELFDGEGAFLYTKEQALQLEHSLVSLAKWESKWRRPFLSQGPRTREESLDYVRCMTLTQNVDPNVYRVVSAELLNGIAAYINAPMTATTFPKSRKRSGGEIVTAEVIYYWMIRCGIPVEFHKWHLNRLLTLIDVCCAKGQKPQKIPQSELLAQRRELNAARRKKWNTRG